MPAGSFVNFLPSGRVLQVEYAMEAVRKGSTAVGVRGPTFIVMGVEKRSSLDSALSMDRLIPRIMPLDDHMMITYAGFSPDARTFIHRLQDECQMIRCNMDRTADVSKIIRIVSHLKQKSTMTLGNRPYGISCLIGGFTKYGITQLYRTDPGGDYNAYHAVAVGRAGDTVMQYFEQTFDEEKVQTMAGAIKFAISGLLAIAQEGQKDFEMAVVERNEPYKIVLPETVAKYVNEVEMEKKQAE